MSPILASIFGIAVRHIILNGFVIHVINERNYEKDVI